MFIGMSETMEPLKYIMKNFDYDGTLQLYIHKKSHLPTTMNFDHDRNTFILLDQRKLPYELVSWTTSNWKDAATVGIKEMVVRGSQAIGCAAAYCYLLASNSYEGSLKNYFDFMKSSYEFILNTRPTAVNLRWALDRMAFSVANSKNLVLEDIKEVVKKQADTIFLEDMCINTQMRENGLQFIENGDVIFTHCNAGSLATSYGGSSLSILTEAYNNGKDLTAIVKETRPRSQGYKLTMWELTRAGIPVIGVTDNMVSSSALKYRATKVFTGADRITKDGYVANKVGTHDLAIITNHFQLPFYVAASYSTLDFYTDGSSIPIEVRDCSEIYDPYSCEIYVKKQIGELSQNALDRWPPFGSTIHLYNPGFDVTPPSLIKKIILDVGVYNPFDLSSLSEDIVRSKVQDIIQRS